MGLLRDALGGETLENMVLRQLSDYLWKEGQRLIRECNEEAEYVTQTSNLDDSFGYAVYDKSGKIVYHGFVGGAYGKHPKKEAFVPRRWYGKEIWGRSEIEKELRKIKPTGAMSLVLYAAMPYAQVLESGGGGIKRKYRVISMSFEKLMAMAGGTPGVNVRTILGNNA